MRPFISANLGLAPFALFWTLLPLAGLAVAIGAALMRPGPSSRGVSVARNGARFNGAAP